MMAAMTESAPNATSALVDQIEADGLRRGDLLAVAYRDGVGVGLATKQDAYQLETNRPLDVLAEIEQRLRPRWVWWSIDTPSLLTAAGLRVATCWDLSAVHKIINGGWKADVVRIWCGMHGLSPALAPVAGQLDLSGGERGVRREDPVRPNGYLRAEWVDGAWGQSSARLQAWAKIIIGICTSQQQTLTTLGVHGTPMSTARSESAAELLCAELSIDGLPVNLARAEQLITAMAGPRPTTERHAELLRRRAR